VQSIQQENKKSADHMVNIVTTMISVFERAVHMAFPNVSVAVVITPAAQEKFGDYQCNSAMNIAQVTCCVFRSIICSSNFKHNCLNLNVYMYAVAQGDLNK